MRSLGPRDHRRGGSTRSGEGWFHLNLQALAMQTQAGPSLVSSAPVAPEQRSRAYRQGMEQDAHLARFGRCAAAPLALLPQRTGATIANAGGVDHPQTAIAFSAAFMRNQHVICWAPKRPIGLERKVGSGEAASFPGRRGSRGSISRLGSGGSR